MGSSEHLSIYINDERLDEFLSKEVDKMYLGLIPTWLNYYDEEYAPSMKDKQYVWKQTRLENGINVLPILLCPDDFDFSCATIVVEVIDRGDTVIWNRFGKDVTEFSADEVELPWYEKVCIEDYQEWRANINGEIFSI